MPTLTDFPLYYGVYEWTTIGLAAVMIGMLSYILYYSFRNTCGFCFKSIVIWLIINDLLLIVFVQKLVDLNDTTRVIVGAVA